MNAISEKPRMYPDGRKVIYVGRQMLLGLPTNPVGVVAGAGVEYHARRRKIVFAVKFPTGLVATFAPRDLRALDARNKRTYLQEEQEPARSA
jgi:hypothetical protein